MPNTALLMLQGDWCGSGCKRTCQAACRSAGAIHNSPYAHAPCCAVVCHAVSCCAVLCCAMLCYALQQLLLASPHRTMDPEEADLFYVPAYPSCFMWPVHGWADYPWWHSAGEPGAPMQTPCFVAWLSDLYRVHGMFCVGAQTTPGGSAQVNPSTSQSTAITYYTLLLSLRLEHHPDTRMHGMA